ncbi:glycosyltransferase family 4 protein [Sphingobacterium multivorum]|uniref:glycosyltransferase family 4 protein n=1 Tax=Sphingobacterium multivorum TaxID=28454 RepID=UPI0028B06BCA|nr:glycosyltransferase family 4 protein [Sphingobacterium multivorum]
MRILIVTQYFWPENFKINDIASGLRDKGHKVAVLTGLPNYPAGKFFDNYTAKSGDEIWEEIKIFRCKIFPRGKGAIRLFLNYISFALYGWIKVSKIKAEFDAILVYEPSPITVGIPAIRAAKKFKAPLYFWVQDLWPESLTAAGGIKNPFILSIFDKITRYIYKKSDKILIQSNGFRSYIENQGVASDKIVFYPNTTENFYYKKHKSVVFDEKLPLGFRIMFAGNLGEAQSLNTLIEAAEFVKKKNKSIKWVILGEGRAKEKLIREIETKGLNDTVFLLGAFPGSQMPDFFACSDALIASLKIDPIFALTIPSKIQSYLACGKPILASLNGEGAKIVDKANCGYSSNSEDSLALANNVLKLYSLSEEDRLKMGDNAINYFNDNFERNMLLDRLEKILSS